MKARFLNKSNFSESDIVWWLENVTKLFTTASMVLFWIDVSNVRSWHKTAFDVRSGAHH